MTQLPCWGSLWLWLSWSLIVTTTTTAWVPYKYTYPLHHAPVRSLSSSRRTDDTHNDNDSGTLPGAADDFDNWMAQLDPASDFEETSAEREQYQRTQGTRVARGNAGSNYNQRGRSSPQNNSRNSNDSRGGRGRFDSRVGHDYTRDYNADDSRLSDEGAVHALLAERNMARQNQRYDQADVLRDLLLSKFGVGINDKEKLWRTGCSAGGSGQQWARERSGRDGGGAGPYGGRGNDRRERGGRGGRGGRDSGRGARRDFNDGFEKRERGGRRNSNYDDDRADKNFGPNGHDYVLSRNAGPNASTMTDPEIHELLAERLQCKLSRRFREADAIQRDLLQAGVFVHDGAKEWRADGQAFDLGGGGGGRPAEQDSGFRTDPYQLSQYSDAFNDDTMFRQMEALVEERRMARLDHNYDLSDQLREQLQDQFNVVVNDRLRQWSIGGDFAPPPKSWAIASESAESIEELWDRLEQGALPDAIDSPQTLKDYIQDQIHQRDQAKRVRNYDQADAIQDDLLKTYDIVIDDGNREWSIGGTAVKPYAQSEYSIEVTTISADQVQDYLLERDEARAQRAYAVADEIKFGLLQDHNIVVRDDLRQWSVGGDFGPEYRNTNEDEPTTSSSAGGYTRTGGGDVTSEQLAEIERLLEKRAALQAARDYGKADRIRDQLKTDYQVRLDDRNRTWHVVTNDYTHTGSYLILPEDHPQVVAQIMALVNKRALAKLRADYDQADVIRDQLMQEYGIIVDDRLKEWRIIDIDVLEAQIQKQQANGGKEVVVDELVEEKEDTALEVEDEETEGREDSGVEIKPEDLTSLTVPELKDRLREANLPVSGKKAELIERLQQQ